MGPDLHGEEEPVTGALVISWGANVPGREAKGIESFTRALGYFEELSKEGRIHGHREYVNVSGRDGGFVIIDGELEELQKIMIEDEFLRRRTEGGAVVEDFRIELFLGGTDQSIQEGLTLFAETLNSMGMM
jgi:hypothetical protein